MRFWTHGDRQVFSISRQQTKNELDNQIRQTDRQIDEQLSLRIAEASARYHRAVLGDLRGDR